MARKYRSAALAAVHETAADLHQVAGIDNKTMRNFDALCLTPIQDMTPKRIRALRNRENASQTCLRSLSERNTQPCKQVGARREAPARGISQAAVFGRQERLGHSGLASLSKRTESLDRFSALFHKDRHRIGSGCEVGGEFGQGTFSKVVKPRWRGFGDFREAIYVCQLLACCNVSQDATQDEMWRPILVGNLTTVVPEDPLPDVMGAFNAPNDM